MCGTSLGLTAGAWFTRVDVAASLGAIMSLPFYYYSGFLRPVDSIPIAFRWLSYISPFRWVFFSLMLNEYKDSDRNVNDVLGQYNIHGTVGESIGWLIVVLIGFRLLAFVGLKWNSRI
jgi:ABC-type multidrug transport system permease subunit